MTSGTKIGITLGSIATVSIISLLLWKRWRSNNRDKIEILIPEMQIDWANKRVPYEVKRNGKFWTSGIASHRPDLVGKTNKQGSGDGKNEVYETHLPNGLAISAESLGSPVATKLVDFGSKKVTNLGDKDINKVISDTSSTIKNLFV